MKKVYVISKSGHDYSKAQTFGELCYLSSGRQDRYDVNGLYRSFHDVLQHSSPDDYILLTGLPVMQGLAMSIMSHMHGRLNLLLFKGGRGDSFYLERNLILKDGEEE